MSDPRFLSPEPCCACVYRPPAPDGSDFASAVSPLLAIAQECSPRYERHRNDLVSIDVSGLDRLMRPRAGRASGPPRSHWKTIGEELRSAAAVRGVRVHVAVAATQTTALVLAQVRPGVTIVEPAQQAEALASVPIGILERIPGVPRQSRRDPRTDSAIAAVKRWGLHTLGELAALPTASLTARLGREAIAWQAIARGDDLRPLVPELPEERFENSLALEWPIEGLEPLSFVLTRLLEPLSIRLERRDRGAAVLHVLLRLVTRETHVRRLQLPSPIRDVRTLRTLALLDLESHPPRVAIDGVTVVIDPTPGRVLQHTLFTHPHPTPEQLSTLLARLGALMGQERVGTPTTVDSYRPGAFEIYPFKPELDPVDRRKTRGDRREPAGAVASPPAESAHVVSALRRCRSPVVARVVVEGSRPVRVATDRQGFAGGRVVRSAGPWRVSGCWWGEGPGETPWNREEWEVALTDGSIYRMFRDCDTDRWFLDAIVD